jgi:hypothetical protein
MANRVLRMAQPTIDELNTVACRDRLARVEYRPGDVVRVLLSYRGNGRFAPDGNEGIYLVETRMDDGKGSDYKLIRLHWSSLMPDCRASLAMQDSAEGAAYRTQLIECAGWDVIAHASRIIGFRPEDIGLGTVTE